VKENQERIGVVRNDRAANDFVVAWGPALFERLPYRFADLGQGGFRGFDHARTWIYEHAYLPGGHGVGVRDENLVSLARFVVEGEEKIDVPLSQEPNAFIQAISNICWLVWLLAAALIVLPGWWAFVSLGWAALAVWVGLVLALLLTI